MDDQRFLAPAAGYVSSPARAMDQLECVSESTQQQITEAAERYAREQKINRRQATSEEIERELAYHQSRCRFLERELKRLRRPVS